MSKAEQLIEMLREGWQPAEAIRSKFDWNGNTLRGAISIAAKKHSLKIERRRENGVTSYRAEPAQ